jgi:dolichol-phosphate mannosyltransferase
LPELIGPVEKGEEQFTLGSRYIPGGATEGEWGLFRKINSLVATWLAKPLAGTVRDPMSGFFALKRSTYLSATRLTPLGYKIALELICKARVPHVKEVPILFGLREKGESKMNLKQQFKYLEHLSRLYDFTFPRLVPIAKFGIVLALGWLIGLAVFWNMESNGISWPASAMGAYAANLLMTMVFHVRYIRTQREFIIRPRPWLDFALISLAELAVVGLSAIWVARRVINLQWWELFVISFGCGTVLRYILRKELLLDVRGLRKEMRKEELTG